MMMVLLKIYLGTYAIGAIIYGCMGAVNFVKDWKKVLNEISQEE